MMDKELITYLNNTFSLELKETGYDQLKKELATQINHIINTDFTELIRILYTVDVNESKLKTLLKENSGSDAGEIIAELIIERQLQKIRSRREHRRDNDIDDAERW